MCSFLIVIWFFCNLVMPRSFLSKCCCCPNLSYFVLWFFLYQSLILSEFIVFTFSIWCQALSYSSLVLFSLDVWFFLNLASGSLLFLFLLLFLNLVSSSFQFIKKSFGLSPLTGAYSLLNLELAPLQFGIRFFEFGILFFFDFVSNTFLIWVFDFASSSSEFGVGFYQNMVSISF